MSSWIHWKKFSVLTLAVGLVWLLLPASIQAQYVAYDYGQNNWEYQFTLFSWLPSQSGTVSVGDKSTTADLFFKDLMRGGGWALNGHVEAKTEKLVFILEGIFIQSFDKDSLDELNSYITLWEGAAGYSLTPYLDIIGGGRYFKIKTVLRLGGESETERKKGWFDPFIGARTHFFIFKPILLFARADVGGFGLGSKFSYNVSAGLGLRLSNFAILGGYRVWDVQYESGSGQEYFQYDVKHAGPEVGFTLFF